MKISSETRIKEIIEKHPQALSIFAQCGFDAENEEILIEEIGTLMLGTVLKVKDINQEIFINLLEEKIQLEIDEKSAQINETPRKINFIGYTYCPLKLTFKDSFEETYQKYLADTNDTSFKYYVPSGCVSEDPYEDLWKVEKIDQLPDIIASVGFGDFFRREFVEKFVNKGYFKAVPYRKMHKEFILAGIIDPKYCYTVYSAFPLVILIDRKKLGNLPVPERWSDLLNPEYADNIILGASHGDIHEELLLYMYKDHGEEGIIKLAPNIKTGWHASQMAKVAGSNSKEGAAIYVIPWMFAKSCPRTDNTKIIWPSDGAIITPNYMLVKETAVDKYSMFIDFLTSPLYGQKSADNYFPAINAEVNNKLPEGASFKWLGWDYIRTHSIDDLKNYVVEVFQKHWKGQKQFKEMVI
ncbi:MAG: ABC transporter substrate-binding protein [Bacillota bacterium]|nr:ABC transporter substrate-binding protein [Bacillota bacterium]